MIPSANDQKITTESFGSKYNEWPDWMCDCCGKFYDNESYRRAMEYPGGILQKPVYVEVKKIRYFACSSECARILFNIHHQYAMRESSKNETFYGPVTA